jgi:hypothetical protein
MTSIKFSAVSTATAATSITVSLGGTPAVGDLVLVFLGVDSEIITHQPGWASEFGSTPNPWFKLEGVRSPDSATLTGWYHTWNASDSGSSVTFTFIPAPTLSIGDKDLSTVNGVAVALVLDGSLLSALLEHNGYGSAQDSVAAVNASPLKIPATTAFHAVFANGSTASLSDSDGSATLIAQTTLSAGSGLTIAVFSRVNSPAVYGPKFTLSSGRSSLCVQSVSVSDSGVLVYNPPYSEEGPAADNPLLFRYKLFMYFTVRNNAGTFSAKRYLSTDDLAAATQVFTNNQPVSLTDRTNILTAGVGGDFQALS